MGNEFPLENQSLSNIINPKQLHNMLGWSLILSSSYGLRRDYVTSAQTISTQAVSTRTEVLYSGPIPVQLHVSASSRFTRHSSVPQSTESCPSLSTQDEAVCSLYARIQRSSQDNCQFSVHLCSVFHVPLTLILGSGVFFDPREMQCSTIFKPV